MAVVRVKRRAAEKKLSALSTQHSAKNKNLRTHAQWLDTIPGGLAWTALVVTICGAYRAPSALLWGVSLLALYSALRFGLAGIAVGLGLRHIQQWEKCDWRAEYARRDTPDSLPCEAVHHLVLIPNYGEDVAILRRTLTRLAGQDHAAESITVVLAMEAAEAEARAKGEQLRAEFAQAFARILVTVHPANLPGERQCKSANLTWAIQQAQRVLIDDLGYDRDQVVVTAMDADTLWHPLYFACLTTLFATDPQRYRTYWQAPIRYHGNVWAAHPLMRLLHAYSSAWELAYLAAPWWRALPMSSYSVSLRLLQTSGYWDPTAIADEWHMYIKSYFRQGGDQHLQPVFLPFWANATVGATLWQTITARYRQTFRHAWGAQEIGYALDHLLRRAGSPALGLIGRVAHDNLLAGAGWIVLFLGAQLPLVLHPTWAQQHVGSPAFVLLQASFGVVLLLTLVFWVLDVRLRPPRQTPWLPGARVAELLSLSLMALLTVICVALPVLHAQTWLMLGRSIRFRVTAKV